MSSFSRQLSFLLHTARENENITRESENFQHPVARHRKQRPFGRISASMPCGTGSFPRLVQPHDLILSDPVLRMGEHAPRHSGLGRVKAKPRIAMPSGPHRAKVAFVRHFQSPFRATRCPTCARHCTHRPHPEESRFDSAALPSSPGLRSCRSPHPAPPESHLRHPSP